MKHLKQFFIGLALLLAIPAFGQNIVSTTTLSSAVADAKTQTIVVASATGISAQAIASAPGNFPIATVLIVDTEQMFVKAVNGTTLTVIRAWNHSRSEPHASGATVSIYPQSGAQQSIVPFARFGACTASNNLYLPRFIDSISDPNYGWFEDCFGGQWQLGGQSVPFYQFVVSPNALRSVTTTPGTAGNNSGITAQAGAATTNSGGTGGAGGAANLTGGAGGAASTGAATGGAGGAVNVTGGAGGGTITGGAGGLLTLGGGNGANGSTAGGAGGGVTINGGNAGTGGTPAGGVITLVPGTPTSTGATGFVVIAGAAAGSHLNSTQTTAPAAGGTCTTPAVAAGSTDFRGQVSSASCTASQTMTATFNKAYGTAPFCTCSPANAAAAVTTSGAAVSFCSASTTVLTVTSPASSSTAGAWNYVCSGSN